MEFANGETRRPGNGHLFWGVVFSIMGVLALHRGTMVFAGIPLWALSFMAIGLSNLLKAPRVQNLLRIGDKGTGKVALISTALNIAGFAAMLVSIVAAFTA